MDYLKGLNDRQKEAVLETEGPILIMAGAGSGKTKVVTHKIAYLIEEKKIFPGNILAITFTNKAADEMKERVAKLLKKDVEGMWIGTFHAVCARILRKDIDKIGYDRSFSIYDRDDQITLVRECINELNINKDLFKESSILARISSLKDEQISPDEYINENYNNYHHRKTGEIYDLYVKKLKEYNALDFDDLILKAVELLNNHSEILSYYQKIFQYVFVDEYQDTNKIQYELVKLLSGGHENICVVGDSDQSIYSFRGADISNILDFEKDFPGAKVILLEQNYRSTQTILNAANQVIKYNFGRKEKNLWTANSQGKEIIYEELENSDEEAQYVAQKIHHLIYKGHKPSDIAILYRTNAQSRAFEEAFMKEELPYKIVGGLRFYDRKEVKDVLAYLRVLQNPTDRISLKRIINTPRRGIGAATVAKIEEYADSNGLSMYQALLSLNQIDGLSTRAKNRVQDFVNIMTNLMAQEEALPLNELIEEVINSTGYLADLKKDDMVESRTRIENIMEFLSVAVNFQENNDDANLENFLASVSLLSDVDKTIDEDNLITLMTVHSAKGLEFKVVFLVGMEEGLFPISRSLDSDEDLEEERRLCYVAITRAEEQLFITSARRRILYGRWEYSLPSRFITELGDTIKRKVPTVEKSRLVRTIDRTAPVMPNILGANPVKRNKKDVDINIGDKVKHKKFGQGMVVQIKDKDKDKEITVAFDNQGIKRLLLSVAPIEIL